MALSNTLDVLFSIASFFSVAKSESDYMYQSRPSCPEIIEVATNPLVDGPRMFARGGEIEMKLINLFASGDADGIRKRRRRLERRKGQMTWHTEGLGKDL